MRYFYVIASIAFFLRLHAERSNIHESHPTLGRDAQPGNTPIVTSLALAPAAR